jgi:catechol 2,3-dioxygenase-like lactoylglutathione lyase family enzyme
MTRPSKLAHVVYMTRRFDEILTWYKAVFEAKVQYENPAFAFLTFDDEHHRFAFANMSALDPEGVAGVVPHGIGVNCRTGSALTTSGTRMRMWESCSRLTTV